MKYPKKKKRQKMGIRQPSRIDCAPHRQWVRSTHECCVGGDCEGRIQAAHVRRGTDGGTSMKPSDIWVIPLCSFHHSEQHTLGEISFEKKYKFSMKETAEYLARTSPHKSKWADAACSPKGEANGNGN